MFNRVTSPVEIFVLKFNLLFIRVFAFHLLTFILTLWYQMKIVPTRSFHHNLLSTSKGWHIWCFKNLQIILVFSITYLTILFHPGATICSFFIPSVFFCMCVLLFVSFSQALQVYATDQILYFGCLSQFSLCQWFRCLSKVWFLLK